MKDKIITAILVIIVGIILLPLAKFNDTQETQELKGFSARDIQFIESIGFVSNGDGTWTLSTPALKSSSSVYFFDYKPIAIYDVNIKLLYAFDMNSSISIKMVFSDDIVDNTFTTWPVTLLGGDVS